MNATDKDKAAEPGDIEALLPWHAAGTLSHGDAQRVEDALTRDPELARRYALVREELGETIHLNETLGAPSTKAMEKLFAKIDAEPKRRQAASPGLAARIAEFFASLSPRTLAWSAGVAALAIMLQAGVIASVVKGTAPAGYQTASTQDTAAEPAPSHSSASRRRRRPATSANSSRPTSCRSWPARSRWALQGARRGDDLPKAELGAHRPEAAGRQGRRLYRHDGVRFEVIRHCRRGASSHAPAPQRPALARSTGDAHFGGVRCFGAETDRRGGGSSGGDGRPMSTGMRGDGGGHRGGFSLGGPSIMLAIPSGGVDEVGDDTPRRRRQTQRTTRRGPSGVPPAGERRLVPDEVVIEVSNSVSTQQVDALQRRHRLTRIECAAQPAGRQHHVPLAHFRSPLRVQPWCARSKPTGWSPRRSRTTCSRCSRPNPAAKPRPRPQAQAIRRNTSSPSCVCRRRMRSPKATSVLVAVIDSAVDASHPDLAGAVADSFDALDKKPAPHKHGTAIAGLIAAHGKLLGAAPAARILAVRAFDPTATAPKAPRSVSSRASTGRRRTARASSI